MNNKLNPSINWIARIVIDSQPEIISLNLACSATVRVRRLGISNDNN